MEAGKDIQTKTKFSCWVINSTEEVPVNELQYSPCGQMIACVSEHIIKITRIIIKDLEPFKAEISCYDSSNIIEVVKWSSDSKALMAISFKGNYVEIINPVTAQQLLFIQNLKDIILSAAVWLPDSQHVILFYECGVFSSVYSLSGKHYILPPICMCTHDDPLLKSSPDGLYSAFIQFIGSGYHLVLISTVSWNILWIRRLEILHVSGLLWSSDSLMVVVWFHSIDVNIQAFELNGQYCPPLRHVAETNIVVKTIKFSPCNKLLAVMCEHHKESIVLVYNILTWQLAAVLDNLNLHKQDLRDAGVFKDCSLIPGALINSQCHRNASVAFSACGNFLATPNHNGKVFVWNMKEDCSLQTVLDTGCRIIDLKWHPHKAQLAVVHGFNSIMIWKFSRRRGNVHKVSDLSALKYVEETHVCVQWARSNLLVCSIEKCLPKLAAILIKKKKGSDMKTKILLN